MFCQFLYFVNVLSTFLTHTLCGLRQSCCQHHRWTSSARFAKTQLLQPYIIIICIKCVVIPKIWVTPCHRHAERRWTSSNAVFLVLAAGGLRLIPIPKGTLPTAKRTGVRHVCVLRSKALQIF